MTSSQTDSTSTGSLSPLIRFGTSTWTYEGWKGQVYKKSYPKSRFKQDSLAEYAAYEYKGERLFRTVGIDHTFYGIDSIQLTNVVPAPLTLYWKLSGDGL